MDFKLSLGQCRKLFMQNLWQPGDAEFYSVLVSQYNRPEYTEKARFRTYDAARAYAKFEGFGGMKDYRIDYVMEG